MNKALRESEIDMLIVKIGGGAAINLNAVAADLACIQDRAVLVLGANALRNHTAQVLGKEIKSVTSLSGYESVLSDREVIDLCMMTYAGLRNKRLVEFCQQAGVNAVGLCGLDGGMIKAQRNKGIRTHWNGKKMMLRDFSGKPKALNRDLIIYLLENRYVPVLTVPIMDEEGFAVNAENDEIVALLHQELHADQVVHLIEAPGLLSDPENPDSLVASLKPSDLESWETRAEGRMKRKIRSMIKLFNTGAPEVFIADGRIDHPLQQALSGKGTRIT